MRRRSARAPSRLHLLMVVVWRPTGHLPNVLAPAAAKQAAKAGSRNACCWHPVRFTCRLGHLHACRGRQLHLCLIMHTHHARCAHWHTLCSLIHKCAFLITPYCMYRMYTLVRFLCVHGHLFHVCVCVCQPLPLSSIQARSTT